jgi:hypothetical protein
MSTLLSLWATFSLDIERFEMGTYHFRRRDFVRDRCDVLADVVAREPAATAFQLAVPPARNVAVVDADDLAGPETKAGRVLFFRVVVVHGQDIVSRDVQRLVRPRAIESGIRGRRGRD